MSKDSRIQQKRNKSINSIKSILILVSISILVVIAGVATIYYSANKTAQQQIYKQEQIELAEKAVSEKDYDLAIEILKKLQNSDKDEEILQLIQKCKMLELKESIVVKLTNFTIVEAQPSLGQYNEEFLWKCHFTNNTDKSIKGLEITAIFSDMFGDEVKKAKCKFTKATVNVGEGYGEAFSLNISSSDARLVTLVKEEILFDYHINAVVYEDGTKFLFNVYQGYVAEAVNEEAFIEKDTDTQVDDSQTISNDQTILQNSNGGLGFESPSNNANSNNNSSSNTTNSLNGDQTILQNNNGGGIGFESPSNNTNSNNNSNSNTTNSPSGEANDSLDNNNKEDYDDSSWSVPF